MRFLILSEDNCAVMAVKQLRDYMENGNITNSVNYPDCHMGICTSAGRIAVNHQNIPNMIAQLTAVCAADGINITDMINKSKGAWAYTMIDLAAPATEKIVRDIDKIEGIVKVRIIK